MVGNAATVRWVAKAMLENIAALDLARNQSLDRALMAAQIDPKTIKQCTVDEKGVIHCICAPPPPPPAPAPGEGEVAAKAAAAAQNGVAVVPPTPAPEAAPAADPSTSS